MKGKNLGWMSVFVLSFAFLLFLVPSVSSYNFNETRWVSNLSSDIDFATGMNVSLTNSNWTVVANVSSDQSFFQSRNTTLPINATFFNITFGSNDTTRIEVNVSLNGGWDYINNVTSGSGYNWVNAIPGGINGEQLVIRVGLKSAETYVTFTGANLTFGINITTTSIGNLNIVHAVTGTNASYAMLNATVTSVVNPLFFLNDTAYFNINGTGGIYGYNNVSNSGWYSVQACANARETNNCRAFTLNLSNDAPINVSANLTPSADPQVGSQITCTLGGNDSQSDPLTYYYNWYADNVLLSTATSTFTPSDAQANAIVLCEGTLFDGQLNSTKVNSTAVHVLGASSGGGGGGGVATLPVVSNPPALNVPKAQASAAPVVVSSASGLSAGSQARVESQVQGLNNLVGGLGDALRPVLEFIEKTLGGR